MIFEDLHWIDPTSRELLDLTVEKIAALPVLLTSPPPTRSFRLSRRKRQIKARGGFRHDRGNKCEAEWRRSPALALLRPGTDIVHPLLLGRADPLRGFPFYGWPLAVAAILVPATVATVLTVREQGGQAALHARCGAGVFRLLFHRRDP
jgi:hypothetical protein